MNSSSSWKKNIHLWKLDIKQIPNNDSNIFYENPFQPKKRIEPRAVTGEKDGVPVDPFLTAHKYKGHKKAS